MGQDHSAAQALETLAVILRWDRSHTIIVVTTAYLDDSGHEDDPNELVLAIGGATATVDEWSSVLTRWSQALNNAGLDRFHGKSFDAFWRTYPDQANPFIAEGQAIYEQFLNPVIAYGDVQAYSASLRPMPDEPQRRRAHDFAVEWCFNRIFTRDESEVVHVVFSRMPKYVGRVAKIHAEFKQHHPCRRRIGDIVLNHTPQDDRHLQVADLVVSGYTKGLKRDERVEHWSDWFFAVMPTRYSKELRSFSFDELAHWTPRFDYEP